jgi:hypothetical protein
MRNLNSILIEGVLLDTPVLSRATSDDEPDRCTFSIGSEPEAASVPVVSYGRLALRCSKLLDKGSVIRTVGHIALDPEATARKSAPVLYILAEHIEIRPIPTPKSIPEEAAHVF